VSRSQIVIIKELIAEKKIPGHNAITDNFSRRKCSDFDPRGLFLNRSHYCFCCWCANALRQQPHDPERVITNEPGFVTLATASWVRPRTEGGLAKGEQRAPYLADYGNFAL
jgi:hypothetical protein